jgi:nucleotide-binding universal stress UspA family protein
MGFTLTTTTPNPAHPIPPRSFDPLPPILCAVTLDTRGKACLRYACQRAAKTGHPLSVVHIAHQTMRTAGVHQRGTRSPRLLLPIIDIAHDLLNKFIDEFQQELASVDSDLVSPELASVVIDRIVEPGIPGTRVPDLAERIGATTLIVGGTRRTGWQRLLRGSVAADVLRHATIPVVVVDSAGRPIDPQDILPDLSGGRGIRSLLTYLTEGRRRATL